LVTELGDPLAGKQPPADQKGEQAEPAINKAIGGLTSPTGEHARVAGELLLRVGGAAWVADLWELSAKATSEAQLIGEQTGQQHVALRARALLAATEAIIGDANKAAADADAILEDNHSVGKHFAAMFACVTHGIRAVFSKDFTAGLQWNSQAMRHQRALGVRSIGDTLEQRGSHLTNGGQFEAALRCYGASCAQHEREGRSWPRHPMTPESLEHIRSALSPDAYERNWSSGKRLGSSSRLPDEWD
jgi:hypothetical protein